MITEIISVFSRKPVFGYTAFVLATIAIAAPVDGGLGPPHVHDRRGRATVLQRRRRSLIAVPTGIKFFNWIATMWGGQLTFPTPMLWAIGFLYLFLIGGITGVMLASPPLDFHAPGHVLRGRPLPQHADRRLGLRDLRRRLLLVPEDDRAGACPSASAGSSSGCGSSASR